MSLRTVTKKLGTLLAAGAMTIALAVPAHADHETIAIDGNLADLITAVNNNLGSSQGGFKTADVLNDDVCTLICCYVNGFDAQNYYMFLDFKHPGGAVSSTMDLYAGWDVVGAIGDTDGDGDPNIFNPILHPGCAISDPAAPGKIGNGESYTIEIDFNCDGAADMSLSLRGDGGVTKLIRLLPGPAVDISSQAAFAVNAGFLELRIDNFQAIVSAVFPDVDLCHARITMTANSENDGMGEDRSAIFALDVPPSVKITKTPSTQTVCPGSPVSWTIQVTNDGLCKLSALAVDDIMDAGLIFDSSTPPSTGDAQHRHWDFTNLVSGASQSITLNAHSGDVCVAPVLHNTVHATGTHTPPVACGEPEAAEVEVSADVNCSSPTVTLEPAGPLCVNAAPIQLVFSPPGGTCSGTGVSAGCVFDPAVAGVGSHVITYSFTDPNGCSGSDQETIVVNGLPTVTLEPAGPACVNAAPIQLVFSPPGGTCSGTGVSAGCVFNPAVAGVGSHVITYSFTDANGCSNSAQRTIVVNGLPTVTLEPAGPLCVDAAPIQLAFSPPGGACSGTGVSAGCVFNPAVAGVGSHVITYSFTDANGCSNSAQRTIVVNGLPTVTLEPAGPACVNAAPIQLVFSPPGGTCSGTGVSAGCVFNPAVAGVGSHVITYSFTDANGCSNSAQRTIVVNGLPTVTLEPAGPLCVDAAPIQLVFSPPGGTCSGTGVSAGCVFNPAAAGAGSHVITYSFTDANGCSNSAQRTIVVNGLPNVTLDPIVTLCNDAVAIQLNGQPAGGSYSGTGVSATGLFSPATAGLGSHVITYSFTDANGCSNSASTPVAVQVCEQVCWLTAGGAKIAGAKGPAHSWGGNVYPGCSATAGDGGNWNHNAHDLNLHLLGTHLEVIRCGNVPGIPPGSDSPKTPNNFIEFTGTGRLQGVAGNKADYPLVYFFARCEDRHEPGSKGQPNPLFVDRYFLHVYSNPANPAGSTLLLVNGNADPTNVVPVPITDGNMQIHITSCDAVPVPVSAALAEQPGPLGPQGQQSQQAQLAQDAPVATNVTLRSDQPVPNPFVEMTRIAYDVIGTARYVEIGIYDLAGRKLRSLVSDRLEPGQYSVTWDGRTDRGESAPRGMYFVRTEVRGQAQTTRRVMYLK